MDKIKYLKEFAESLGCILIEKGTVGFGRDCVGILESSIEHYVDINPYDFESYYKDENNNYDDFYIFGFNEDLEPDPDSVPNAYHKHSCLAVLVHDGDFSKGISELYEWIVSIRSKGEVGLCKHSEVELNNPSDIEKVFAVPYKVALIYQENK